MDETGTRSTEEAPVDGVEYPENSDTSSIQSISSAHDGSVSPAPSLARSQTSKKTLMILGSADQLLEQRKKKLSALFEDIVCIPSLEQVTHATDIPYAILSIVELGNPIFLDMNRNE